MRAVRSSLLLGLIASCVDSAPLSPAQDDAGAAALPASSGSTGPDASAPAPVPAAPPSGPFDLASRVDRARYTADLTMIAQSREPGTAHWQAVQDLCASRFAEYGFTVERHKYETGVNVVGVRTGKTEPASEIILGAHYDSVEKCPGADDNASGVAGVLEAARVLSLASYPKTLVVICWDEEERIDVGSKAHAKRVADNHEKIEAVFDLEMIGYKNDAEDTQTFPTGFGIPFPEAKKQNDDNKRRADFIAAIADPHSASPMAALSAYAAKDKLPFMSLLLKESQMDNPLLVSLKRSDHAAYWEHGYPGIMITDTSNFRYEQLHCRDGVDELKNVDLAFATQVTKMIAGVTAETLGMKRDF